MNSTRTGITRDSPSYTSPSTTNVKVETEFSPGLSSHDGLYPQDPGLLREETARHAHHFGGLHTG